MKTIPTAWWHVYCDCGRPSGHHGIIGAGAAHTKRLAERLAAEHVRLFHTHGLQGIPFLVRYVRESDDA